MNNTFYFEKALQNLIGCNEYTWKKEDDNGNKIPNSERMQYKYVVLTNDELSMPTEAKVNAKIQELKDAEANAETKKASGKQKLIDLGLSEEEVKALIGV
jgi:hypothetical protein